MDLDGLLYDTEPLYWQVGSRLLARRGHTFTDAVQRQMMGRPGVQAMQVLIEAFNLNDDPAALLAESETLYQDMLAGGLQPMPGLAALIAHLEASGLPFGVATSSRRHFADQILARDSLADRLAFLITGDDVTHGKPHPEMYLQAAEKLNVAAEAMLVLEDSENGCQAAVAAGAIAVAVPGGHSVGHRYDGAALVIDRLDDPRLLSWLPVGA